MKKLNSVFNKIKHLKLNLFQKSHDTEKVDDNKPAFDLNLYSTKKNIAQGMLDLSLLSANCSQLKYLLFYAETHNYYYFLANLICIIVSIFLQIIIGILLIINVRHNVLYCRHQKKADSCCNCILIGIFLITIINVFLGVFISAK